MRHAGTLTRRRLYLMRHGAVSYFDRNGRRELPEQVQLTAVGRSQAKAAGLAYAADGIRFDRVIVSGLPRTQETARLVLEAVQQEDHELHIEPSLQEIRGGRLSAIADEDLPAAFTGLGRAAAPEPTRFLGGESVGELLDRVLPSFTRLLADSSWHTALLVLHGAVNTALLSHVLSGGARCFFGTLVQAPGCINVIDAGPSAASSLVRLINLSPTEGLYPALRESTLEALLDGYLARRQTHTSTGS